MKLLLSTFFFISSLLTAYSRTAEEWKSRSVYQIITDRFAKTDGDSQPCDDFFNYCGGTFKGILNNLDYIQGMGFDAIWISPVVANTAGGYHGYWASNLYEINENFGTPEELIELIDTCHQKDIWVMVDVVANHMGYTPFANDTRDFSEIVPFNDIKYYNTYKHCDEIDFSHQPSVETCWLNGLPDLDQNNPYVKETLLAWAKDFVQSYNIDALRIDTVPHVPKNFWAEFSRAAGVYTIGEVLNHDLPYLASYQGAMDAVLNYALFSTLRYTFQNRGSMTSFEAYYEGAKATWPDMTVLGNFVNNHDNPRFLSGNADHQAFKSALALTISSVGIPMVYYGDEQAYGGGQDPMNREPLWTNMDTETDIYKMLKTLNNFRKDTEFWKFDQIQRYSDDSLYAFTRGDAFFAFTNTHEYQSRNIHYHPYADGTVLCNIFHREDCVEVQNGEFPVVLINGEFKAFTPINSDREEPQVNGGVWKSIKLGLGSSAFNGQSL